VGFDASHFVGDRSLQRNRPSINECCHKR
jgi:hypothetical protein